VPEFVADVGPPTQVRLVLLVLLCIAAVVLGFYLYRVVKAHRSSRLHRNENNEYLFSSSRASGLSLPELPAPETSPTLGDTSSETSSPEQA